MMMKLFNFNFLSYLLSLKIASLKHFLSFFYNLFYNPFCTKSSFLFSYNVGWNKNFLNIYNIIKLIFIFIWEQLTTLIPPLKLFSSLFSFLIEILNIFKDIFNTIIGYVKTFVEHIKGVKLMNHDEGLWEKIKSVCVMIFTATVGGMVIYFLKDVQTFILGSFVKISDLLFKIVLKILDIILIVSKILQAILKNVIIFLRFILSFLFNFNYPVGIENINIEKE